MILELWKLALIPYIQTAREVFKYKAEELGDKTSKILYMFSFVITIWLILQLASALDKTLKLFR